MGLLYFILIILFYLIKNGLLSSPIYCMETQLGYFAKPLHNTPTYTQMLGLEGRREWLLELSSETKFKKQYTAS